MLRFSILFLLILFCISCQKEQAPEEQAIMRIGSATLTEKDLTNAVGLNAAPDQKLNYIRQWSDKELAYYAAVKSGFDKDETAKKTIENMKKEYLSTRFIQQQMGRIGSIEVSNDEVREEYKNNSQSYARKEPVIKVAKIVFNYRTNAWKTREDILAKGSTFESFRTASAITGVEIPPYDDIKFTAKTDFNTETWNTVFNMKPTSVSLPIEENGKYLLYMILAKENAESQAPFEEVMDDIKRSVLKRKQREFVENIYTELRNRDDYYYNDEYMANLEKTAQTGQSVPVALEETVQEENQ